MSNYFATVSQAIDQHTHSWPHDTPFQDLGNGSIFSWKVEVLLYEDGKGWKFENATIFQRLAWKIAKYIPIFSGYYKKVNLDEILPLLIQEEKKTPSAKVTLLRAQIESLWQKKNIKPASQTAPSATAPRSHVLDPHRQKLQELNLGWILPKKGPIDFISYTNPQAKLTLKAKDDAKPCVELYYIPPGKVYPENGHGEFFAVVQDLLKLKTKAEVEKAAIIQQSTSHSPDVICQQGDKIRIYNGVLANGDQVLLYKEYNSIDEALESYLKEQRDTTYTVMTELFSMRRSLQSNYPLNNWTLERFKNDYAKDPNLAPFMKGFVVQFNDGVKKIEGKDSQALKNDPVVIELRKLVTDTLQTALLHFNAKEQAVN